MPHPDNEVASYQVCNPNKEGQTRKMANSWKLRYKIELNKVGGESMFIVPLQSDTLNLKEKLAWSHWSHLCER
jgi:hypothetical protein